MFISFSVLCSALFDFFFDGRDAAAVGAPTATERNSLPATTRFPPFIRLFRVVSVFLLGFFVTPAPLLLLSQNIVADDDVDMGAGRPPVSCDAFSAIAAMAVDDGSIIVLPGGIIAPPNGTPSPPLINIVDGVVVEQFGIMFIAFTILLLFVPAISAFIDVVDETLSDFLREPPMPPDLDFFEPLAGVAGAAWFVKADPLLFCKCPCSCC